MMREPVANLPPRQGWSKLRSARSQESYAVSDNLHCLQKCVGAIFDGLAQLAKGHELAQHAAEHGHGLGVFFCRNAD
jgi:hypothetical protein